MPNKNLTAFATFDGAAARAFLYERAKERLAPLPGFPANGQRKPEFDDKRGRVFQSFTDRRSAAEPQSDPEKLIERDFVADIAQKLEQLRAEGRFERLIIAAGPRALGYWRDVAPKELAAIVKSELVANHVNTDEAALLPLVEKEFFG